MIKKRLNTLLLILTISLSSFAQNLQPYLGCYRVSGDARLVLAENNIFYIVAYATFFQGNWHIENDKLILNPHNPEHFFELYGRYNPNIKGGYKIKFDGFSEEETFIGKDNSDAMQRVFNKNPNCFESAYLQHFNKESDVISFVDVVSENIRDYDRRNTYSFPINKYNDFIAVYNDPRHYNYEMIYPFPKTEKGIIVEDLEQFGKMKMTDKLRKEMDEIIKMGEKMKPKDTLYFNPAYRLFDEPSMNISRDYSFDRSKNAYVSKHNYEKDEELHPEKKQDAYHSKGILYQYDKIPPTKIEIKPFKIIEKSIFTANCAGDE
ncbi:hypothetical protein [Flavobacterium aestivum]|uniref:hypothetical protein n=1 Tax=Flavobacterium aestivum TaxID=3003257 RepID=UPI00248306A8|nr:hypothetical protein [Flavobacterium aestivum]